MYVESDETNEMQFITRPGIRFEWEWTPKYSWFILPTFEINASFKEVSFNFLCLGVYCCWGK